MYHRSMAEERPVCPNCGAQGSDYQVMPEHVDVYAGEMTIKLLPKINVYIGTCVKCGHTEKYHYGVVATAEGIDLRFLRAGEKDALGNGT